jgi:hypothetical protein
VKSEDLKISAQRLKKHPLDVSFKSDPINPVAAFFLRVDIFSSNKNDPSRRSGRSFALPRLWWVLDTLWCEHITAGRPRRESCLFLDKIQTGAYL